MTGDHLGIDGAMLGIGLRVENSAMNFMKLQTSDGDTRWINLDLVSRVTTGVEPAGDPFVAVIFADGAVDESLIIHGTDEKNREAIDALTKCLDAACA